MRFVAVDLETANPNMSSICQIGMVTFENGREIAAEVELIDPQTWFHPQNVDIHGIDEQHVAGAKTFPQLHDWICARTAGEITVCHTHFDRVALSQACQKHQVDELTCTWLDSARVTRRAWSQFASRGYGLGNVAKHLGITFQHHDALHDARTAGLVLLRAIEETGHDLAQWLHLVKRSPGVTVQRLGDGDGSLVGQTIVFTGALQVPRREAADRAAAAGADVQSGVTKHTTVLVVGDQDISRLNGHDKSNKHAKAEVLIAGGQRIRIIGETDFMALAAVTE